MRRIVIVQARFASTRLPGKVMLSLGASTVLHEVLIRCAAIPEIDDVCCAVSDGFASEIVAAEAEASGAKVFVGPDGDVLARYLGAARQMQADEILRVTSDCPLIDPELCAKVLAERARSGADYCANNFSRGFPYGLDCEAFTREALEKAAGLTSNSFDREHVTPFLCRDPAFRRKSVLSPDPAYAHFRWTLDYPEDYRFFHAVFRLLKGRRPAWLDLAKMLAGTELPLINASRSVEPAANSSGRV